ncbi:hypothetical protein Trydic_g14582 [Trypoxylus dichotomus]
MKRRCIVNASLFGTRLVVSGSLAHTRGRRDSNHKFESIRSDVSDFYDIKTECAADPTRCVVSAGRHHCSPKQKIFPRVETAVLRTLDVFAWFYGGFLKLMFTVPQHYKRCKKRLLKKCRLE